MAQITVELVSPVDQTIPQLDWSNRKLGAMSPGDRVRVECWGEG